MKTFLSSSTRNGSPSWRQLARSSSSVIRLENSCLILKKICFPRLIKPRILKLTFRRGQSNFSIIFTFGSCDESGNFRVVWVGQPSFVCRSYCGLRRRMQGASVSRRGGEEQVIFPRGEGTYLTGRCSSSNSLGN